MPFPHPGKGQLRRGLRVTATLFFLSWPYIVGWRTAFPASDPVECG